MRNLGARLPSRLVPAAPGVCAKFVVWCDWCETDHTHSAEPGHRVAHCSCADSPHRATGYELSPPHEGSLTASAPDALFLARQRLRDDLARVAPRQRSTLLATLLGVRATRHFSKKIGRARINVFGDSWVIDPDAYPSAAELRADLLPRHPARMGRDFITLLATLYGMARGVVGVRLLEAISGISLDAEGKRAIAAEIDAAYARKADACDGRS